MEESNTKEEFSTKDSSPTTKDEKFPDGLRVLAVDDNVVCLMLLERLLQNCRYNVTLSRDANATIDLLKENKDAFDIVITDVHMTNKQDGFKLLETIGLEMDIPVVMVSSDDDKKLVYKAIKHGACDYLVKPLRLKEIKNIWQHVIRKTKFHGNKASCTNTKELQTTTTTAPVKREREHVAKEDIDCEEPSTSKRPRFSWTGERHAKFVTIVSELGDNAAPSKILEKMGIPELTRQQVASHLQKFRSGIKKTRTKMSFGSSDQELILGNPHITINNQGVLQVGQQVHRSHYINQLNNLVHAIPQTIHTLNHYNQTPMFRGNIPSSTYPELYNFGTSKTLMSSYPSFGSMSPNTQHSRELDFWDPSCGELIPNPVPFDMELLPQPSTFHVNEIFSDRTSDEQLDIPSFGKTLLASTSGQNSNTLEEQQLDMEYLFQHSDTTYPHDDDDINEIINSTLQGVQ